MNYLQVKQILIKKHILSDLKNGKINLLFETHALFQNKIKFLNLGFVIIDEQHKFVLIKELNWLKGRKNCDLLLISANLPRTMMLSFLVTWIYPV